MNRPSAIRCLGAAACIALSFAAAKQNKADEGMRKAVQDLAASLSPEQRDRAVFGLAAEHRLDWHYVPRERVGLAIGELDATQRERFDAVLKSALSERGARQVEGVLVLEGVLREREGEWRDPGRFHFALYGDFAGRGSFGWRFEGHHVSLHFDNTNGAITVTPLFLGANPAAVAGGAHDGLRVLGDEQDLARELVLGLDEARRAKAIRRGDPAGDVVHGPGIDYLTIDTEGLLASEMAEADLARFWKLVGLYTDRLVEPRAKSELGRIRDVPLEELLFTWIGSTRPGEPHAYRIQGPRFVIEYDNGRPGADHVHTLWRDFDRDFGGALKR
jgi:hypothetical protein